MAAGQPGEKIPTRVARAIARHVAEAQLEVGTVLPDEKAMAQSYGIGRNSVREALRLLEAQGLIELRRGVGGGPVVAAPTSDDFGKTMTMFLQMQGTTFDHLTDALASLEGTLAALAAARAASGEASLEDLVAVLHREDLALHLDQDPDEADPFAAVGVDFHRAMLQFVGNDVLTLIVEAVEGIWIDRTKAVRDDLWSDTDRARVHREHLLIFNAIQAGDQGTAQRLMSDHIAHEAGDMTRLRPEFMQSVVDWR